MSAVLGEDGAKALKKAAERSNALENALLPRTIFAWLNIATKYEYEGEIPGVHNTYVNFKKSDDGFSGSVTIGDDLYSFTNASMFHVAASVAVAIGVDGEHVGESIRDVDVERLGKSIDLLAKAKIVTKELQKSGAKKPKGAGEDEEGTGKAHAATKPQAPEAPVPTQPLKQLARKGIKIPKIPKPPGMAKPAKPAKPAKAPTSIKLSQSESKRACAMCGLTQFKGDRFAGCLCFRDLAKNAKSIKEGDSYTIQVGGDWDQDAIVTFLESIGRK